MTKEPIAIKIDNKNFILQNFKHSIRESSVFKWLLFFSYFVFGYVAVLGSINHYRLPLSYFIGFSNHYVNIFSLLLVVAILLYLFYELIFKFISNCLIGWRFELLFNKYRVKTYIRFWFMCRNFFFGGVAILFACFPPLSELITLLLLLCNIFTFALIFFDTKKHVFGPVFSAINYTRFSRVLFLYSFFVLFYEIWGCLL